MLNGICKISQKWKRKVQTIPPTLFFQKHSAPFPAFLLIYFVYFHHFVFDKRARVIARNAKITENNPNVNAKKEHDVCRIHENTHIKE